MKVFRDGSRPSTSAASAGEPFRPSVLLNFAHYANINPAISPVAFPLAGPGKRPRFDSALSSGEACWEEVAVNGDAANQRGTMQRQYVCDNCGQQANTGGMCYSCWKSYLSPNPKYDGSGGTQAQSGSKFG